METIVDKVQTGDVFLREFDIGVYASLDNFLVGDKPYVPLAKVPSVRPPLFDENHKNKSEVGKPMPGIPIIISNPGDSVQRYNLPCFRLTREDPSPALERWMSIHLKHRTPSSDATEITVILGGKEIKGYDKYEEQKGSWPFDIPYTVTCEAAGLSARTNAQTMLKHLMKGFEPYSVLTVIDSFGVTRKYNMFVEGPSELSEVSDIRDRVIIHAMSVRISGELDLSDPKVVRAITSKAEVRTHMKE